MLKCFEMCRETSLFLGEGTLSDYAVADLSEIVTVDDHTLWTTVDVLDALSCTMREQDETSSSQTHDSPETQTSDPTQTRPPAHQNIRSYTKPPTNIRSFYLQKPTKSDPKTPETQTHKNIVRSYLPPRRVRHKPPYLQEPVG